MKKKQIALTEWRATWNYVRCTLQTDTHQQGNEQSCDKNGHICWSKYQESVPKEDHWRKDHDDGRQVAAKKDCE